MRSRGGVTRTRVSCAKPLPRASGGVRLTSDAARMLVAAGGELWRSIEPRKRWRRDRVMHGISPVQGAGTVTAWAAPSDDGSDGCHAHTTDATRRRGGLRAEVWRSRHPGMEPAAAARTRLRA